MPLGKENYTYATFLSLDHGKSNGSGFRLEKDGSYYIVTAKHVLYNENNELRSDFLLVTSQNFKGNDDDLSMLEIDLRISKIEFSATEDLAVICLNNEEAINVQQEGNNIVSATNENLINLSDIQITNDLLLVGFPTSLIMAESKFFDINRPLLRKGIVAGINEKDNTFIIDCPAYYGNSGGPVLDITDKQNMKIMGLVSRYVPFVTEWRNNYEKSFSREEFSNSGYAVCTPLDRVFDLIENL